MRLVTANTPELLQQVYEVYFEAFPEIERKPIYLIEEKVAEGSSEVCAIFDDGEQFVGFAIFVHNDTMSLLDFFAIAAEHRNRGLGGAVFSAIKNYYPGKTFVLEIEDPYAKDITEEERKIRQRRRGFYLRQGMVEMPFLADLFGLDVEVLSNGSILDFQDYHSINRGIYGPMIDEGIRFVTYLDGREGVPMVEGHSYPARAEYVRRHDGRYTAVIPGGTMDLSQATEKSGWYQVKWQDE